jgi:hypothetical protein
VRGWPANIRFADGALISNRRRISAWSGEAIVGNGVFCGLAMRGRGRAAWAKGITFVVSKDRRSGRVRYRMFSQCILSVFFIHSRVSAAGYRVAQGPGNSTRWYSTGRTVACRIGLPDIVLVGSTSATGCVEDEGY